MSIKAQPLTAEAFAPYGSVLTARGDELQRDEYAGQVESLRPAAKPNLTFMKVNPKPTQATVLERHPFSHQLFVPMNAARFLVCVCPSDDNGDPIFDKLEVFLTNGRQSVNYNVNVWHGPLHVLFAPGEFTMLRWDDGTEGDIELRDLPAPVDVELPD
jgi:ureidoglycolate lyase